MLDLSQFTNEQLEIIANNQSIVDKAQGELQKRLVPRNFTWDEWIELSDYFERLNDDVVRFGANRILVKVEHAYDDIEVFCIYLNSNGSRDFEAYKVLNGHRISAAIYTWQDGELPEDSL